MGQVVRIRKRPSVHGSLLVEIVRRIFLDEVFMSVVSAPTSWVEDVSELRLPQRTDERLQSLMDRNNEGALTVEERDELASLTELSERISLVRANALLLLGRRPL